MVTAVCHNPYMSKKADRHLTPGFQIRLHPLLKQQLDALVDKHASTISEEVRVAIRERLERTGLWPVQDDSDKKKKS